jgi:hypothetical protein
MEDNNLVKQNDNVMKMMNKTMILLFVAIAGISTSCDRVDPLSDEQYVKEVYMIGAYKGVYQFKVAYSATADEWQDAFVSVAIGGSQSIDKDVTVALGSEDEAIDKYNDKYMRNVPVLYQRLPDAFFDMPSTSSVIKAGEVYANIPFSVDANKLHCDSLYALSFKIDSTSDHGIDKLYPTLIMNLAMVNDYSGVFQLMANRHTVQIASGETLDFDKLTFSNALTAIRTLKAVDYNTVRFFNETAAEARSGYLTNEAYWSGLTSSGLVFTRETVSNDYWRDWILEAPNREAIDPEIEHHFFNVASWIGYSQGVPGGLNILGGVALYNTATGVFVFGYDYQSGSTRYHIEGTLAK